MKTYAGLILCLASVSDLREVSYIRLKLCNFSRILRLLFVALYEISNSLTDCVLVCVSLFQMMFNNVESEIKGNYFLTFLPISQCDLDIK